MVIVAALRGAGDHFAQEAGEEKDHAQHQGHQGQVEERLVRDGAELEALGLRNQFVGDDPDGHHKAHQEHQDAAGDFYKDANFKRFNIGIGVGEGIELSEELTLLAEFQYGLLNMAPSTATGTYKRNAFIKLGVKYAF